MRTSSHDIQEKKIVMTGQSNQRTVMVTFLRPATPPLVSQDINGLPSHFDGSSPHMAFKHGNPSMSTVMSEGHGPKFTPQTCRPPPDTALHGKDKGKPIMKPWTIYTNNPEIVKMFMPYQCNHERTKGAHAQCRGKNAVSSEDYTPKFAELIHRSFDTWCYNKQHPERSI